MMESSRRVGAPVSGDPAAAAAPGAMAAGVTPGASAAAAGPGAPAAAVGPGAPAGSVFVKRSGVPTARFAEVDIFVADTVTRLAERASLKLDWGTSAAYVDLFLVKLGGEDEPTDEEEAAALAQRHLGVGWSLSRAQIASGAWVVAQILVGAPAAAPGE